MKSVLSKKTAYKLAHGLTTPNEIQFEHDKQDHILPRTGSLLNDARFHAQSIWSTQIFTHAVVFLNATTNYLVKRL